MSEQILPFLRSIMVLLFNCTFLFIFSDFKVSVKKAARYFLVLCSVIVCINVAIILILGWETFASAFAFTAFLPVLVCICFLSKDGLWKTIFNYCFQLNNFFILYFISSLSIYLFQISVLTDIFLRFFCFVALLFLHIRFVRRQFRIFAMYINKGWCILALVSLFMTALFMVYILAVELKYQNALVYSIFALICLLAVGIYVVVFLTFQNTYDLMLKSQTEQSMKLQTALQKEQYNAIHDKIEIDKAFRHDLHHHANLLIGMLTEGKAEDALTYVQRLGTLALYRGGASYCKNLVVNTILAYHIERARAVGMTVKCRAVVPEEIGIDEMELCTALSNLLENATQHGGGALPQLTVSILQNKEQLCIRIENSFDGMIVQDGSGNYRSAKPQGGGIGLQSVAAIVNKHEGVMNVAHTDTTFTVDIALKPIK